MKKQKSNSNGEQVLNLHIRDKNLPTPLREKKFSQRLWRFDFCWPDLMLAAEVEGGAWIRGRHTRGAGFEGDCEKYNAAAELGWTVLRYTTGQVRSGEAVEQIGRVIGSRLTEVRG